MGEIPDGPEPGFGYDDVDPAVIEQEIRDRELSEQHRSHARMAYRLAAEHGTSLMHVYGLGWHSYDGARWALDERGRAEQAVLSTLRRAAAESVGGDQGLWRDIQRCQSGAGVDGVLRIAKALPAFAFTPADLDRDAYLLNVRNGTLDLRTLSVRAHDPLERITKVCGAAYDPGAAGPTWERFLGSSLPDQDVRAFLQRYVGQALVGEVIEHVLAILTGTGRNGKGVFYGALGKALGDYATTAEPDLFMHRENAHPTGEMDLLGVRWVVVSESDEGRKLAQATVKRLTGGDRIKARKMRQDFVEFDPSHTCALITNHLPKVPGDDPAMWARLRVIPFDVVIPKHERDPHLGTKLAAETDAVLAWCLAGWQAYREDGLGEPEAVMRATAEYQSESDTIGRFIAQRCVVNRAAHVGVGLLFERFSAWAAEDGAEPVTKRAFGDAMDRRGYPAVKTTGGLRVRRGLGLAADADEDGAAVLVSDALNGGEELDLSP